MKKILTYVLVLLLGHTAWAQERQVVASTGQDAELAGFFYSYTVGEVVVTTVTNNANTLTQGFQQPEAACVALTTTVSTNDPTDLCKDGNADLLTFANSAGGQAIPGENYKYIITDDQGNILQDLGEANSFDFENLEPGSFRVYGISHLAPITLGPDINSIESACFQLTTNFLEISLNDGPSDAVIEGPEDGSVICGTSIALSATAPTSGTGTWTGPAGVTFVPDNTSPNVEVTGAADGELEFTWTVAAEGCGEPSDETVSITYKKDGASPATILTDDTELCEGAPFTAQAEAPGAGETGAWSANTDITFSPDETSPTVTILNLPVGQTTLTWTISSDECDANTDQITVTVTATDQDVLGEDVTLCEDAEYEVVPNLQNYTVVAWSTGETTPTIRVRPDNGATETVAVELVTADGCVIMDAVNVSREDLELDIESTPVCINDGELTPAKLNAGNFPGATYEWSTGENTSSIEVEQAGSYTVTVSLDAGCTATQTVDIEMDSYIAKVDPEEIKIGQGETVVLNASGGDEYTWTPPDGLSCTTCEAPEASPSTTTTYTVVILRNSGCQESAQAKVEIGQGTCDILRVPNVITPLTRDGLNDQWEIGGLTPDAEVNIYDRWGGLIFQATNYQNDWTGLRNGTSQVSESGTYFYIIRLSSGDVCRGSITVLK